MTDIQSLQAKLKEAEDKYRTRDQALEKAVLESLPSAQGLKELVAQAKADVQEAQAKLEAAQREAQAKLEAAQREAKLEAAQREAKLEAAQREAKLEAVLRTTQAKLDKLLETKDESDPAVKDAKGERDKFHAELTALRTPSTPALSHKD